MAERVAIPEIYEIYQQDLTKDYLSLIPMGFVRTIEEARAMCKVFSDVDEDVSKGRHTYLIRCSKLKGEKDD